MLNTCCKDARKAPIVKAPIDFAGQSQSDVPNQWSLPAPASIISASQPRVASMLGRSGRRTPSRGARDLFPGSPAIACRQNAWRTRSWLQVRINNRHTRRASKKLVIRAEYRCITPLYQSEAAGFSGGRNGPSHHFGTHRPQCQ